MLRILILIFKVLAARHAVLQIFGKTIERLKAIIHDTPNPYPRIAEIYWRFLFLLYCIFLFHSSEIAHLIETYVATEILIEHCRPKNV